MVIDAQATPLMAREVIRRIRRVTSKPIQYVVLTHYHAVRVLGASAYGAEHIIASEATLGLIRERGRQDMASEIGRFPRLFRGAHTIPGLTWPTLTFRGELALRMGSLEVRIIHPGPGHTGGDTIVWVPSQRVLFSGDLVEYEAGVYTGDAHLEQWPHTLEYLRNLKPKALVPGRGPALTTPAACERAIRYTQEFVRGLYACAKKGIEQKKSLKEVYAMARRRMDPKYGKYPIYEHCMPFDVSPRILRRSNPRSAPSSTSTSTARAQPLNDPKCKDLTQQDSGGALTPSFRYQANGWTKARRVAAKVEWHQGELYPRIGFIVTNLTRPNKGVVKFYNGRGTAEQHIKEGKNALRWTRLSCHAFRHNAVRLQLHALAYNLANFLRTLALPERVEHWSLTTLREKLVKIGARIVRHGRYVVFRSPAGSGFGPHIR